MQRSSASLVVRLWYFYSALLSPVRLYAVGKQREQRTQGTRPPLNQCLRQLHWRLSKILTPLPLKHTSNPMALVHTHPQKHWIMLHHQLMWRHAHQSHPLRTHIRRSLLHPTMERRALHRIHCKKMCITGKKRTKKIIPLCLRKSNFCKMLDYQRVSL